MPAARTYNAADLRTRIRTKYAGQGFLLLDEVGNRTGMGVNSFIDMVVLSIWPTT